MKIPVKNIKGVTLFSFLVAPLLFINDNWGMKNLIASLFFLFPYGLFANVGGSDLQNFNPSTNGLGFISVHSSQTLNPLEINVGSFLTYATNSLSYSTVSTAPNNQTFSEPNDRLLYSDIHLALGLLKGWEFGFSAGFINSQNIEQSNFLFSYGDTGINDFRLNTKVRLVNKDNWGLAFVTGVDFDQIKNNPFAGNNPGPTFNFEGVADIWLTEKLLWAANFGYRLRQAGTPIPNTGVTPMADQWTYSTALSYLVGESGSAVIGELYGSYPVEEFAVPTDRQLSNLEALVGYRWSAFKSLDVHAGLGTEIYHGLGSPDFRAFLGINLRHDFLDNGSYEPAAKPYEAPTPQKEDAGFQDGDNDGVPDPIDQCPSTWGQNYVDEKGCATKKLPSKKEVTDTDQDGIIDQFDRCPGSSAGSRVNGFGCEIKEYNR